MAAAYCYYCSLVLKLNGMALSYLHFFIRMYRSQARIMLLFVETGYTVKIFQKCIVA